MEHCWPPPNIPFYNAAYFKALPFIVELRRRNGRQEESEIETCSEALYGVLLLRLPEEEISEARQGRQKAVATLSRCLQIMTRRSGESWSLIKKNCSS